MLNGVLILVNRILKGENYYMRCEFAITFAMKIITKGARHHDKISINID